jgi:hypothetical protein
MSTLCGVSKAVSTVIAGVAILAICAGCSSAARENDAMKDAFDTLMKRPSITALEADYQSMYTTIRERLIAEVGVAEWVPDDEPMSSSGCGEPLSNLDDGEQRTYGAGWSPGNLPDAKWGQAVAIVTEVAKQHGFGGPRVVVDGPSDHEVSFHDTYDGSMLFGTGANTILGGFTGCHLSEKAHQRGTYLPPKKY